jgi:hypothetical protein
MAEWDESRFEGGFLLMFRGSEHFVAEFLCEIDKSIEQLLTDYK